MLKILLIPENNRVIAKEWIKYYGCQLNQFRFVQTGSFIVLAILIGCTKTQKTSVPVIIPVSAVKVEPSTIPANFEFVAVAESSHIIELRARVEGYLESINYKEGSLVKTGDLMFVLDQRPFIASLEMAQGELASQEAILWNARQTKARMIPLYDENAVSEKDLDNALADELSAKAKVDTALANVYQAELNLGFASIKAPATAMASKAKYREGDLISPGEQNLLTTLYVVDPIWINFSVSDRDLLKLKDEKRKGQIVLPADNKFTCEAILADGTIIPSSGFIDFMDPAIQQDTGTMLIRTVFGNSEMLVYPGQFVKIIVKGATRPNCIIVPQTAIIQSQDGPFVYVINKTGRLERREVSLGDWYQDYWIVLDGLKSQDLVVAVGVNKVKEGSQVTITNMLPSIPKPNNHQGSQGNTLGF